MADHHGVLEDVRRGMIPAHIYNDKELFELEKERLFSRSWLFVAHESEVPPEAGDYVVRRVLEDSFIISRDEQGQVRALFNMCLHRGMQVCRAEMGNASHFRCPYHGWSYRNDGRLVGLPFHKEAYGGGGRLQEEGPDLVACSLAGHVQRSDLHQHGPGCRAPGGVPGGGLQVLPGLLHEAERGRHRAAWPSALAGQGELEDRGGRELRRGGHVPHAPDPHLGGGDRPLPRAQGGEAQGRHHVLGWQRWRHHLQAARRWPGGAPALRGLPGRDDRPDEGAVDPGAARRGRQGRVHDLGGLTVPEHELRP